MLGKLLKFIPRRTKSPYADDKAIADFTRVCKEQGLELDYGRDAKRIKELIEQPGEGPEGIAELAMMLGQSPD